MRLHPSVLVSLGLGLFSACGGPSHPPGNPDAATDAPAVCEAPGELCDGVCVDVSESSKSCGRCGHTCGGGACVSGTCQPVAVADAADQLDQPAALAVNADAIFWNERTRVRACPLPIGCTLEPRLIADIYYMLDDIAVTGDLVYFTGCRNCDDHYDLWQCPFSGCPEPAPRVSTTLTHFGNLMIGNTHAYWLSSSDALLGCQHADCAGTDTRWGYSRFGGELISATIDGDTLYVKPAGTDLRACPEAVGCAAPTIVPDTAGVGSPFRVHRGVAYWFFNAFPTGRIVACPLADCRVPATFAVDVPSISELEVDDSGVYWVSESAGTLRQCPLTGCPPGGAATLASGRASPKALTLGDGFAYWIEGNAILKIAKP
jgi:hypothetical protein